MYKDKDFLYEEFIVKRNTVKSIADKCNVSKSTIENYLKRYSLKRGNIKNTLNESKIDVTNPIFNYYIGLIITDGYLDKKVKRVSIRCKNEGSFEVFTKLKEYFEYTGCVNTYNGSNDLTITSHKLIEVLNSIGVSSKGKVYNRFPKSFYNEECSKMFFRGILDGDGNIHNKVFRITLSNKIFLDDMANYLNNILGIHTEVKKDRTYWKIEMRVSDSNVFLNWLYSGYKYFMFLDKYKKFLNLG